LRKNGETVAMKILWGVINFFQIVLIIAWTAVCGITGILMMLVLWNGPLVHLIEGKYLWSPFVCLITGVRVKVTGLENIDKHNAAIYVSNHASHFDIVAISRVMPLGLFFIAKKELSRIPLMGQYMHLIGHIFVDRNNKETAMVSMAKAAEKIRKGKNVISFAEGTRSKTDKMNIFKRGSFVIAREGKIDVVPIAILGSRKILASGSFSIRPGVMEVKIGKRIRATDFVHLSVEEIASLAQERVRAMLNE
jgi:1-acyl-sn-glycerol-3-phosphate acyltransferase